MGPAVCGRYVCPTGYKFKVLPAGPWGMACPSIGCSVEFCCVAHECDVWPCAPHTSLKNMAKALVCPNTGCTNSVCCDAVATSTSTSNFLLPVLSCDSYTCPS